MSPGVPQLDGRFLRRDLTRNVWIWRTIAGTFAMFGFVVLGLNFTLPDVDPVRMFALSAALFAWSAVLFRTRPPEPGSAWATTVVASTFVGPALAMLATGPHGVIGVPSALFAGPLIGIWTTRLRDTVAQLTVASLVLLAPWATGLVDADTLLGAVSLLPAMWVVTFCIVVVMSQAEKQGEQLDGLVRVDALTGVGNRRKLDETLTRLTARVAGGGRGFALITLDLDGFKSVNDQLGHDAGDALLQHVARSLTGAVGDRDVVVRQGGDEFCVVLRLADAADVDAAEQRIRLALADLDVVAGLPVSSGVGRALCPDDGDDAGTLLAIADARLLVDKSDGARARLLSGMPEGVGPSAALAPAEPIVLEPDAEPGAPSGEGLLAFPNGIGRRELEHDTVVWGAHSLMYVLYALMGVGVIALYPAASGDWFPYVCVFGGMVGIAYFVGGPPTIGTFVNHLVVSMTYVVPALIVWSCAPGGSFVTGCLLFVGPLAAVRLLERWQVAAHVMLATVLLTVAATVQTHDVWTLLVLAQTVPVIAILAGCCVFVLEVAEEQTLELHGLVRRDPLTGVGNRRRLMEEIDARARREEQFSVITFDLNGFKGLNDTLGHAAGDELLQAVASCLTATAGASACVARQGGDEFAVVHSAKDAATIETLTVAFRRRLSLLRCGDVPLTTGIGWSIAPVDGIDASELLTAADRRLLADKPPRRAASAARDAAGRTAA